MQEHTDVGELEWWGWGWGWGWGGGGGGGGGGGWRQWQGRGGGGQRREGGSIILPKSFVDKTLEENIPFVPPPHKKHPVLNEFIMYVVKTENFWEPPPPLTFDIFEP